MQHQAFAVYASIINRGSNRFFDQSLAPYNIGCGQQFFLAHIADNEGLSMYDLAQLGRFDKATVSRAIQKLTDGGYITCEVDVKDRRVRRLFTTEAAKPLLQHLRKIRQEWELILSKGLTPDEMDLAGQLLEKIAKNAFQYREKGECGHET